MRAQEGASGFPSLHAPSLGRERKRRQAPSKARPWAESPARNSPDLEQELELCCTDATLGLGKQGRATGLGCPLPLRGRPPVTPPTQAGGAVPCLPQGCLSWCCGWEQTGRITLKLNGRCSSAWGRERKCPCLTCWAPTESASPGVQGQDLPGAPKSKPKWSSTAEEFCPLFLPQEPALLEPATTGI